MTFFYVNIALHQYVKHDLIFMHILNFIILNVYPFLVIMYLRNLYKETCAIWFIYLLAAKFEKNTNQSIPNYGAFQALHVYF